MPLEIDWLDIDTRNGALSGAGLGQFTPGARFILSRGGAGAFGPSTSTAGGTIFGTFLRRNSATLAKIGAAVSGVFRAATTLPAAGPAAVPIIVIPGVTTAPPAPAPAKPALGGVAVLALAGVAAALLLRR